MRKLLLIIIAGLSFQSCSDSVQQEVGAVDIEKQLKEAVVKYPDSTLLIENLVQYYRENQNYDQALNITDSILKKDSTKQKWWEIKATLQYETDDTVAAIQSFERAVGIQPFPDLLISLGSLYAQTRNPGALMVSDALRNSPEQKYNKEAYFIKGLYYNYTASKPKAIRYFDSCLQIDHTYMFAYREKAIALYDLRNYTEAVKVLEKAVTLRNSYEEAHYWLGRCQEKLGNVEEAKLSYQNALLYDKDYVEAREALDRLRL